MNPFSHKPAEDGSPCIHMRTMVSELSDGTIVGIRRWYAERHTHHCPRCSSALIGLVELGARLQAMGMDSNSDATDPELISSPEIPVVLRVKIGDALDRIDSGTCKP